MRTMRIAVLAVATLAAVSLAQTNVYRWTDKDGKLHFSDSPPPEDAKDAAQKRMGGGGPDDSNLPYATQMAARRNPVAIYVSPDCGDPCGNGRELLEKRGVPYDERNPQSNVADRDQLKSLTGGLFVPTLVIGSATVRGYDDERWNTALDTAGYPRTRLPGQGSMRRNAAEAPAAAPATPPGAPQK
ncbi:MAG TPA: glutaredoxin family protein [Usitatibacter sp.]|nr:glutaredoxin family protein [Usitatibacter sp.]